MLRIIGLQDREYAASPEGVYNTTIHAVVTPGYVDTWYAVPIKLGMVNAHVGDQKQNRMYKSKVSWLACEEIW